MNPNKSKTTTRGVESLLGNPKKALIRLAVPNSLSLLATVIYQITDIVWISGLGADALAIAGFFMPFLLFVNAIAAGLGAGGSIKIAQYIGARNKEESDRTAAHTFLFTVVISIPVIILISIFAGKILAFMGAGKLSDTSLNLVYLFMPLVFLTIFNNAAGSILNGEGDAGRMMLVSITTLILNMLLDPLFIYYFKFGIYGTVIALTAAAAVSAMIYIFWFFIKRNTYVSCRFKGLKFDAGRSLSILKLGLPITLSQITGAVSVFAVISFVSVAAGSDGVAVYSTGIRFGSNVMMPSYGIAYALITVAAAAFGTKDYKKMKTAYYYALKAGLLITVPLTIASFVFAPHISSLFTWSKGSSRLAPDLIAFLKIYVWFFPANTLWMTSITFFAGIGYTIFDIVFSLTKYALFVLPLIYLFGIVFEYGLPAICIILTLSWWLHGPVSFFLIRTFLARYKRTGSFTL